MGVKRCPYCTVIIDDKSEICPICGKDLTVEPPKAEELFDVNDDQAVQHFCSRCGRQLDSGAYFCKYCGTKVEWPQKSATDDSYALQVDEVRDAYRPSRTYREERDTSGGVRYVQEIHINSGNQGRVEDAPSGGYGVLSFLFPLIGIILWLVWRKDYPKRAHSCGMGILINIILTLLVYWGLLN